MIEKLKKIFSLNNILICYFCAIGYGIGYAVPEYMGYNPLICFISCIIIGGIFYIFGLKILNSKFFNDSKKRKVIFVVVFYLIYCFIAFASNNYLKHDIDNDFLINLIFIIGFQLLAFTIEYIKGSIKLKRNKNHTV